MNRRTLCVVAGLAVAVGTGDSSIATAHDRAQTLKRERLLLEEFPWDDERLKPKGPPRPGIATIYLNGSERAYDFYTVAYRFDPNIRQPPHSHPDDRSCFVLAGEWHFGYGNEWSDEAIRVLYPGSRYTEPGNAPHFAMSGPQGAVVECSAHGPSGTKFVHPEDE